MRFRTLLARTLVAFALLGLVGAPLATPMPAAAAPTASATVAMADDMPCCPPDGPSMPDCYKSCPLLTVCVSKCFQTIPGIGSPLPSLALVALVIPADQVLPDDLAQLPPARPPRTIA